MSIDTTASSIDYNASFCSHTIRHRKKWGRSAIVSATCIINTNNGIHNIILNIFDNDNLNTHIIDFGSVPASDAQSIKPIGCDKYDINNNNNNNR